MRRPGLPRAALALGLLGGSVLGAGAPAWPAPEPWRMARIPASAEAPECSLTDQDGRPFSLRELRGKPVLLAFVYTSCPDICPLIFGAVTAVQQQLAAEGHGSVATVFVTLDPEVDTPEVLKMFASRRGADLSRTTFLTGSPAALQAVWEGFGVKVSRVARGLVDHTALTVLIDRQGVIRFRYLGGVLDTAVLAADGRRVLGEAVRAAPR
jgi:protein SCO1/2